MTDAINWSAVPSWQIHHAVIDGEPIYIVKVAQTSGRTVVGESCKDYNVQVDCHYADNDRLVGYVISFKDRSHGRDILPRHHLGDSKFWLSIDYEYVKDYSQKPLSIVYHDANIRLLAFGKRTRSKHYLLVVRYRNQNSFIWSEIETREQENEG